MSGVVFYPGGDTSTTEVLAGASVGLALDGVGDIARVVYAPNSAPNRAFVRSGVGAQTATFSDFPVSSLEIAYVFIGFDATHFAAIGQQGPLYVTRGTVR